MTADTTEVPTLQDLGLESCMLASLIEGLDVLNDLADTHGEDITSRRASNAMRPMIESAIKAAWELNSRIEALADAERKTGVAA